MAHPQPTRKYHALLKDLSLSTLLVMNVVLMAGGGGTRLWPLSRRDRPKQFLDLGSGRTLLEHAYERACAIASPSDIFIATARQYEARVRALLPHVPEANIFYEPERRDTAPAFAAAALHLSARGRAVMPTIFLWSDHIFTNETEFLNDLRRLPALIESHPDTVIIMGHRPTFPETGFGYLELGEAVADQADVYVVKAFKEKPDKATAEQYVAAGNFYWNMGYISCRPEYLLQELKARAPEFAHGLAAYRAALEGGQGDAAAAYAQFPRLAIDHALLERTPRLLAITGDYGWSDVGSWATVQEIFGRRGDHMPRGHHLHISSSGCYIYNATGRAVTLIGLKDVIVVVTDDAVLVTDRQHAARTKEVVAQLEADKRAALL